MKKKYMMPEIETINVELQQIIATSDLLLDFEDGNMDTDDADSRIDFSSWEDIDDNSFFEN